MPEENLPLSDVMTTVLNQLKDIVLGLYSTGLSKLGEYLNFDISGLSPGSIFGMGTGMLVVVLLAILFIKRYIGWIFNIAILIVLAELARRILSNSGA